LIFEECGTEPNWKISEYLQAIYRPALHMTPALHQSSHQYRSQTFSICWGRYWQTSEINVWEQDWLAGKKSAGRVVSRRL